ncbi:MAG: SIMPL domain-containing protein [Veillonellaceae bacterium]|nr:SIMPL domain-containing protein [Veillonellaceae bacterium]MDD6922890.1 SIMPL domain-containing protein [Veillonellaceae bacterium]
MNKFVKLCMAICITAAAVLMFPVQNAEAAESVMSVNGTGKVTATPDTAKIVIGVTTYANDAQKAQLKNAAAASAVKASIMKLGIFEKNIRTEDYSFRPIYDERENRRNEIKGYTVDNNVVITINDIDQTGKVIDTALKAGANEIRSLSFSVKDTSSLRSQALSYAVADARSKANIMAEGLGLKIIGVKSVSENTSDFQPRAYSRIMLAKVDTVNDSTPVSPGTIDLSADVHIDFLLGN